MQPSPSTPLAPQAQQGIFDIPLRIVGGNHFGRYNKISDEQTWNMIISDGYLVDYAGYKAITPPSPLTNNPTSIGRGIFSSTIQDIMIEVIGNGVFSTDTHLVTTLVGNVTTSAGEVFIAENNAGQIALSDGVNIYIYKPVGGSFVQAVIDFTPGFIAFQNTYFMTPAAGTAQWRISAQNDGTSWPDDAQHVGQLQTKPDTVQAIVPMPGKGNMTFVFGHTVCEQWTFTGAALFPWQRTSSFNIDYGCINPSSIAYQGNFIVWIGISEEAGPVVMYTTGGDIKEVSTDGIDFKLGALTAPEDCSGFLIKIDGHLIYQFTFKTDNLTFLLDFGGEEFFYASDENANYHIARKAVFFNNTYYFVSFNDANLYEISPRYTTYQYSDTNIQDIPRIRICPPVRLPTQRPLIFKSLGFTIEQGQQNTGNNMAVDLSVSRDGAETFSSYIRNPLNDTGNGISRMVYYQLGRANDFSAKLNFVGQNRFAVSDGIVTAYL